MIAAVTETLAELLSGGTSLIQPHQIDLERPDNRRREGTGIYLYCYDCRMTRKADVLAGANLSSREIIPNRDRKPVDGILRWFHISFLICTWGFTTLGELQALSELLETVSLHQFLPEDVLAASLKGRGRLPIQVSAIGQVDSSALWHALRVPMRPAIYITVHIPGGCEQLGSDPPTLQALS